MAVVRGNIEFGYFGNCWGQVVKVKGEIRILDHICFFTQMDLSCLSSSCISGTVLARLGNKAKETRILVYPLLLEIETSMQ